MLGAGVLTFREFLMREPLPLATIQSAALEFLRGREDVVVFGAQAVNAYVNEPRMTQDIDVLSTRAESFARELCEHLRQRFHVAVRIRRVGEGRGICVFQARKSGNRQLVDIRPVESLPPAKRIEGVLVMAPADLVATKVIAFHQRRGQPKSGTDWRDLAMLLLAFPDLKRERGPVLDRLMAANAGAETLAAWKELVAQDIRPADEEDSF